LAFLTQNKAELCKNLIITLVFEKNANLFAENWQKLQKIVIITSTPGHRGKQPDFADSWSLLKYFGKCNINKLEILKKDA
jgi:hypothetical protein